MQRLYVTERGIPFSSYCKAISFSPAQATVTAKYWIMQLPLMTSFARNNYDRAPSFLQSCLFASQRRVDQAEDAQRRPRSAAALHDSFLLRLRPQ